jgi:cytochrome o ubiquinol oxidase subunit 1
MGMTRRLNHYDNPAWHPWLLLAWVGAVLIAGGIACQIVQLIVSIRDRNHLENRDLTGDPWDARTLEWSIPSPAPFYNFAVIPQVRERDAFTGMKENGIAAHQPPRYADIHMPRNTSAGLFVGIFSAVFGFAAIWHIWWLAAAGLLGVILTVVLRSFKANIDYIVTAAEIARLERPHSPDLTLKAAE